VLEIDVAPPRSVDLIPEIDALGFAEAGDFGSSSAARATKLRVTSVLGAVCSISRLAGAVSLRRSRDVTLIAGGVSPLDRARSVDPCAGAPPREGARSASSATCGVVAAIESSEGGASKATRASSLVCAWTSGSEALPISKDRNVRAPRSTVADDVVAATSDRDGPFARSGACARTVDALDVPPRRSNGTNASSRRIVSPRGEEYRSSYEIDGLTASCIHCIAGADAMDARFRGSLDENAPSSALVSAIGDEDRSSYATAGRTASSVETEGNACATEAELLDSYVEARPMSRALSARGV
jgi:hypothetical protein